MLHFWYLAALQGEDVDAAVYEAALLLQKGREVVIDGHMHTTASRCTSDPSKDLVCDHSSHLVLQGAASAGLRSSKGTFCQSLPSNQGSGVKAGNELVRSACTLRQGLTSKSPLRRCVNVCRMCWILMARAMNEAAGDGRTVEVMAVELSSPVPACQATMVAQGTSFEAAADLLARSAQ